MSEAEIPPVSVAGVYKSRYKGAWLWAMNEEMKGLEESGTIKELKGLPEREKAIGSTWVLSYKSDKDGNITKTKARLVAKGFMHREGVNYRLSQLHPHRLLSRQYWQLLIRWDSQYTI